MQNALRNTHPSNRSDRAAPEDSLRAGCVAASARDDGRQQTLCKGLPDVCEASLVEEHGPAGGRGGGSAGGGEGR